MAHILIVDDEPTVQDLIKDVLSGQGHTFDQASKGSAALKKISAARFDLVILDRSMPGMDGFEVLRTLRASPATADLKVLMCTAAGMMSDVADSFAAGASDYIVKPLDLAKLSAKVKRLIGKD